MMKTHALLLASALLLGACAGSPFGDTPPPASDKTAVVALLDSARAERDAGRHDSAVANIERALRIEPRNPAVWHELARARLAQGRFDQALSLAAKSNALAGGNNRLRADNWQIIGEARAQKGDRAGAQEAFDRAAALQ